ncbi:MAG: hypothetical protein IJ022_06310 [Burkholderiaceae bacterium]|nr:hypothetical protein [Burkholderiaceae bacterium]
MLRITIPAIEKWDERKQEFISTKEQTLQLEHSLVSLSKWESKWCKPFLAKKDMTNEEAIDYIRCMTLTQNVNPEIYDNIPNDVIEQVSSYINAPMTATWFAEDKGGRSNSETVTSELIYYWMIALNIPFKCEKWHLNRLLTLIRVCNIKNTPPKKMSKRALMSRNAALNASRRQQFNSKG